MFIYKNNCNTIGIASQVNSKGYKVCGEASSVCGTITINKRKVRILFDKFVKDKGVKLLILNNS